MKSIQYLSGFKNYHETEALPGTLPQGQNSPQRVAHGLFAEQISGSAFTAQRSENLRTWFYRIRPSVVQGSFKIFEHKSFGSNLAQFPTPPDQLRWQPMPYPGEKVDWLQSLYLMAETGSVGQSGCSIYLYSCTTSMTSYFYNSDGEFLVVPQEGMLSVRTEMGIIEVSPLEIVVIPRGVKFQIQLLDERARGYVCENQGRPFELPGLGPIGANGLAAPRDFLAPSAAYEEREVEVEVFAKFDGALFRSTQLHSPLDVVAWHGNYYPYKYDLQKFNTINTVSFDHPDPSIFTVLTSPSGHPGVANVDFVIFPPRWMVSENSFRPPYFHRNYMNEFMGLIKGVYDAKAEGFSPGGASLHNRMMAHGPDAETFKKASEAHLKPEKIESTMAFMFETEKILRPSRESMTSSFRQKNYAECWQSIQRQFNSRV